MAVPKPSKCLDPTALLSKETAVVVHLADAEALAVVAEEVEAADLEVDLAAVVVMEEEVVAAVAEEEATATSVVSQVTWRETVLTAVAVEDTEEAVVDTEEVGTVETEEVVATVVVEEVGTEEAVVVAEEAATAVVSRDISPGIAPAVDVKTDTGPAVEKAEYFISNMIRSFSRRLLSLCYPLLLMMVS